MKNEKKPAAPAVAEPSADDRAFELELVKANPGRRGLTRFDFPDSVEDAAAVYLFELRGRDEVLAAEAADQTMSDAARKSFTLSAEAEQRESIRFSIGGIVDRSGARRLINQTVPLLEIDDWGARAWRALRGFFAEVNGLSPDDLGKALRGARKIGAGATL